MPAVVVPTAMLVQSDDPPFVFTSYDAAPNPRQSSRPAATCWDPRPRASTYAADSEPPNFADALTSDTPRCFLGPRPGPQPARPDASIARSPARARRLSCRGDPGSGARIPASSPLRPTPPGPGPATKSSGARRKPLPAQQGPHGTRGVTAVGFLDDLPLVRHHQPPPERFRHHVHLGLHQGHLRTAHRSPILARPRDKTPGGHCLTHRRQRGSRVAKVISVTRQLPREDPQARRAMTENGCYVIYALEPRPMCA